MKQGYLIDTSVLSALAPSKTPAPSTIVEWLRSNEERLFISVVTVAEVEQGICKLQRLGGTERATMLSLWLDTLLKGFSDRILALDVGTARVLGHLADKAIAAGRHPGFADVAIAATTAAYKLTLLTRNIRHFEPLGIAFADPFNALPD